MQIFKVKQDGFKHIKKKTIIMMLPVMLIVVTFGVVISLVNSKDKTTDVSVLPIIIPVMVGAVGFGIYRGINRQKYLFETYTLTITNNLITREQLNTPTVSIYFNEVKEITKNKKGGFTIKGTEAVDLIWIPIHIENPAELEKTLEQIHPITVKRKDTLLQKYPTLTAFATLGLMFCVYTVNNKIVVGLTGTLLVALLIWSFIKIRGSKNVDSRTKKAVWWIFLPLASVIGVMIIKLSGL